MPEAWISGLLNGAKKGLFRVEVFITDRLFNTFNKLLIILLTGFLFGCHDPEIPEYLKYNWFAHFTLDDVEYSMYTNSLYIEYEPYISGFSSNGSIINPDGSEEITFITMTSGMNTASDGIDSVVSFEYKIITTNQELIALKGRSKAEKINTLISYLRNRRFGSGDEDKIFILVSDRFGQSYKNRIFSNGTYAVYLDYDIVVVDVGVFEHPVEGEVVRVRAKFQAVVREMIVHGTDQTLTADVQMYFPIPFE